MALASWAAAGRAVTMPRAAIQFARAAAVAATWAVAWARPRLTNSRADPVDSGTSWTRPVITAGSTSSREPRSGRTRTGEPRAESAPAYRRASRTLSGKSNDPTVITPGPASPADAGPGGGPPADPPVHAGH